MEDLYIHIHCARENGVSPVVAQMSMAEDGVTEDNENIGGNGGVDPTIEESRGQVHEFDINSLQFTNTQKENVYRKVKTMRADEANADLDESTLFLTALGGPSHGRVVGFGSVLQKKIANTRDRHNHVASSVYGLTNSGVQEIFSRSEVDTIVQERDCHIAEERAQRIRDQAQNQLLFSLLFKMHGLQQPPSPVPASSSESTPDGILGNMDYLQVHGPTSQPSQEVPS